MLVSSPGRGESLVQQALKKLPDRSRVIRLSHVSRKDVIALYQGADMFVFPSLYEGFGLPVIEAMKAGIPVIATHAASIPEIGGNSIRYFDGTSEDLVGKMRTLLLLPSGERVRLTDDARHTAAKFTWQKTAAATIQCFQEVLSTIARA